MSDTFDRQYKQRAQAEAKLFDRSFRMLSGAVLSREHTDPFGDPRSPRNAIERVAAYFGHSDAEQLPGQVGLNEQIEFVFRPLGIMTRPVLLEKGWHRNPFSPLIAVKKDTGVYVALLPGRRGYYFHDPESGEKRRVTKAGEALFDEKAICFYRQLPLARLSARELFRYAFSCIGGNDIARIGFATLAATLVGMLTPKLSAVLTGPVLQAGQPSFLLAVIVFMMGVAVSVSLFGLLKKSFNTGLQLKMSAQLEAAVMLRIYSLPVAFFKEYASGDLSKRIGFINNACAALLSAVFDTGLTALFSVLYISQIAGFARPLMLPALLIMAVDIICMLLSTLILVRRARRSMKLDAAENGMTCSVISGMQKIKVAGAEKRVFARWSELYAKEIALRYKPILTSVVSTAVAAAGVAVMYNIAILAHIPAAEYYAFNAAYANVTVAFCTLAKVGSALAEIRPSLEIAAPILQATPEVTEGKTVITSLRGGISLQNVCFSYAPDRPNVIDRLDLTVRPGEYVGIVGRSGCGKTTLIRLLLGFEKPQKGVIRYDENDIGTVDLRSLRRKIGTVLQDGKLFQGNIFSNIAVCSPDLTWNEAWEAAELAGVADDIRKMPMGMNTIISEGSGGVSGGQRQRILIARAVAARPRILIFDEATSALDNITQKKVSDALETLQCTRIAVAHRLSTIRNCDRILVLDGGRIAEEGTYEELVARNGLFAGLVARQRLETE